MDTGTERCLRIRIWSRLRPFFWIGRCLNFILFMTGRRGWYSFIYRVGLFPGPPRRLRGSNIQNLFHQLPIPLLHRMTNNLKFTLFP